MTTRSVMRWLPALALPIGGALAYVTKLRPWMFRWGATDDEVAAHLPGDDIIARPRYQTTHAITIAAPARAIWPWLVQMGPSRGGYYSYDWLENAIGLDIRSADRIVAEWQDLKLGDIIANHRAKPDEGLEVAVLDRDRALVYHGTFVPGRMMKSYPIPYDDQVNWFDFTWGFHLRPIDDLTRLVARFRLDYRPAPGTIGYRVILEPQHFLMERKMLLGIKERVERSAHTGTEDLLGGQLDLGKGEWPDRLAGSDVLH